MQENPKIALSWWGDKGGFQIKGTVTIHTNDEIFRQDVAWMKESWPKFVPKSAVLVKITGVYAVKPGPEPGRRSSNPEIESSRPSRENILKRTWPGC